MEEQQMTWQNEYQKKLTTPENAVKMIQSGDTIWSSHVTDTPIHLVNALCARKEELEDVHLYGGLMLQPFDYMKGEFKGIIRNHCGYLGPMERKFYNQGNIDIFSMHLSQLGSTIQEQFKPGILFATCTPPDKDGNMNLGPSSLGIVAGMKTATRIIVQINKNTPYVHGECNTLHISEVDAICEADYDIPILPNPPVTETDKQIAAHIVPHVKDGDTLQIGIGGMGNAVAYSLEDRNDLGVHSEMLVDSVVHLAKLGVITGHKKTLHPRKIVFSFAAGSRDMYDFLDHNAMCDKRPVEYINNPYIIGANDNMVSINSALCADITGQVCSESLGFQQLSSTGGQVDFVRGAGISKGGRSFIALSSTVETKKGLVSKITTGLPLGSVVTTPRSDVHYIVTEYGIADLKNKSLAQRIESMIAIAHPDFRDQLKKEAREVGHQF